MCCPGWQVFCRSSPSNASNEKLTSNQDYLELSKSKRYKTCRCSEDHHHEQGTAYGDLLTALKWHKFKIWTIHFNPTVMVMFASLLYTLSLITVSEHLICRSSEAPSTCELQGTVRKRRRRIRSIFSFFMIQHLSSFWGCVSLCVFWLLHEYEKVMSQCVHTVLHCHRMIIDDKCQG